MTSERGSVMGELGRGGGVLTSDEITPLTSEEERQWRAWLASGHEPFGTDAVHGKRMRRMFLEIDRLRAIEAAAREVYGFLMTSGKEPPPLNDYGLMSTLGYYAGPNARTLVARETSDRVTGLGRALTALRSALSRDTDREETR